MSAEKTGIGSKVLGWFIVSEDEADAPDPPDTPAAAPAPAQLPPPALAAVYRAAEVDDADRERLAKVITLVETLPSEATVEVKRAIVAASLEAFGISIDRILATGEGALAALDAHVEEGQARTSEVLAAAEARIAALNGEIAEVRRRMDQAVAVQDQRAREVTSEKRRVRTALDFFGPRPAGARDAARGWTLQAVTPDPRRYVP